MKYIARNAIAGFPKHLSTLLVQQEVIGTTNSVLEQVLSSDALRDSLLKEENHILSNPQTGEEGAERLVEIYRKLQEIEADTAEERAKEILLGLGFTKKTMVNFQ